MWRVETRERVCGRAGTALPSDTANFIRVLYGRHEQIYFVQTLWYTAAAPTDESTYFILFPNTRRETTFHNLTPIAHPKAVTNSQDNSTVGPGQAVAAKMQSTEEFPSEVLS